MTEDEFKARRAEYMRAYRKGVRRREERAPMTAPNTPEGTKGIPEPRAKWDQGSVCKVCYGARKLYRARGSQIERIPCPVCGGKEE